MGIQTLAVGVSVGVTLIVSIAYFLYNRVRYTTNNPNAIHDNFTVFRNERCPICLDPVQEPDCAVLNCGHLMHQDCLSQLDNHRGYLSTNWCPICRTPILR